MRTNVRMGLVMAIGSKQRGAIGETAYRKSLIKNYVATDTGIFRLPVII